MSDTTIPEDQLRRITGYKQPARQLRALHQAGYHRARLCPTTGAVILERPHFDAVAAGDSGRHQPAPRLRDVPQLRGA